MQIIYAVTSLSFAGLLLGLIVAAAAKYLTVEHESRIPLITGVLPGANCGGCGFVGCADYAAAIVNGGAPIGLCHVAGSAAAKSIADIMDTREEYTKPLRAVVLCCGVAQSAKVRYNYHGDADCVGANLLGGGPKACQFGCIGYKTCVKACPFNAIDIKDGVAVINENCTACGVCLSACPKKLIKLVPRDTEYTVKCVATHKGRELRDKCTAGCIACGICERSCPTGAMSINNNIAAINYEKCAKCGKCAEQCPTETVKGGKERFLP